MCLCDPCVCLKTLNTEEHRGATQTTRKDSPDSQLLVLCMIRRDTANNMPQLPENFRLRGYLLQFFPVCLCDPCVCLKTLKKTLNTEDTEEHRRGTQTTRRDPPDSQLLVLCMIRRDTANNMPQLPENFRSRGYLLQFFPVCLCDPCVCLKTLNTEDTEEHRGATQTTRKDSPDSQLCSCA